MAFICPHCQYPNLSDADICRRCRKSLPPMCPACSKPKNPEGRFCAGCGHLFGREAPGSHGSLEIEGSDPFSGETLKKPPRPRVSNLKAPPAYSLKRCTACFRKIDADATFCIFCGQVFESKEAPNRSAKTPPAPPPSREKSPRLPPRPHISSSSLHPFPEEEIAAPPDEEVADAKDTGPAGDTALEPVTDTTGEEEKGGLSGVAGRDESASHGEPRAEEATEGKGEGEEWEDESFGLLSSAKVSREEESEIPAGLIPLSPRPSYTPLESLEARPPISQSSPPEDMTLVLGATFPYGPEGEPMESRDFAMDIHPVTNEMYRRFVEETGIEPPPDWLDGRCIHGLENCPVTMISFAEAKGYARWAGKRLPTEQEWERAARGALGFKYPWGNDFDPARAHFDSKRGSFQPVDAFPEGASPEGCLDMLGNALEWVLDPLSASPVLRGGSWKDAPEFAGAHTRYLPWDGKRNPLAGFRCAADITTEEESP